MKEKAREVNIENYIPHGAVFAVSRNDLIALTGLTDRVIRLAIADAVDRGVPIVNVGCGYFIADGSREDKLAANVYIRKELSRHRMIIHRIHALQKALDNVYQEDFDE